MKLVFGYEVEYDEMVNEWYVYLMVLDTFKLVKKLGFEIVKK